MADDLTATDTIDDAITRYDEAGGLQQFVEEVGVAGILYAVFLEIIAAISAAGDTIMAPWRALADGLEGLVSTVFGAPLSIIGAGGETAATSFTDGLAAWLGPLAFPAAIASFMLGVYVFMWFAGRIGFSPLQFVRNIRS